MRAPHRPARLAPMLVAIVLALPVPPASAAPAGADDDGGPVDRSLLDLVDELARKVAQARGLPVKRPIARGILGRAAVRARLLDRLHREMPPEEVEIEGRVLKRLGLLPADSDYERLVIDLLTDQVAGFYDADARRLFIAAWLPRAMQGPALVHEIAHALQDQSFDLRRFAKHMKGESDRQLARMAVAEGDGTAVMLEVAGPPGMSLSRLAPELVAGLMDKLAGVADSPVFSRTPPFLQRLLLFPYVAGIRMVLEQRRLGPWSAVDALYRQPPESTEQVLHPEKLKAREPPVAIRPLPARAGGPHALVFQDTLGEAQIEVFLRVHLGERTAERAAAGWGGDRLYAFGEKRAGGELGLVHLTAWDSETDATEFAGAAAQVAAKLPPPAGRASRCEQRGDRVLCLWAVPAAAAEALVAAGWRALAP